jgi:hypothetical protein
VGSGIEGVATGSSERTAIGLIDCELTFDATLDADKTESRHTKRALSRSVKRMFSSTVRQLVSFLKRLDALKRGLDNLRWLGLTIMAQRKLPVA